MIISRIIQNGLDLSIETNDIPFQYSSNLYMKFVKDDAYKDWTLEGYYALPKTNLVESKEYQLKINSDGTFKLDEKFFAKAGTIQFSFKLVETDGLGANVHLGIVKYLVRNSIGDTSAVLPEDKELWYTLVQQEVKKYFETNYSEKLNDFNTKHDDTITKYNEIVETSTEVKKEYDEVASMKKSIDSSKQSIDNTKKQIDSTYDEYKKFANETKIEINNAKLAIINGKNEINTLAKEKVDEYTQKVTDFNNNYNTKTKSLDTKINEIQTKANEIVETSTKQLKENIAESKNDAIKQIQSEGQSYQDQINKLQKSEALQDEVLDKLNEEVDLKLTQPYINNNDSTHITSSDNGLMSDLVIKGNTVQESTKGYQLFYLPDNTKISNGVTTTIKDGLISCEGTVAVNGWFDVCGKLNISLKQGIEYTFSINKALSVRCALKTSENELGIDRIVQVGKTSVQFTPKSDISSAYIWIDAPIGTNIDIQFMIQVEKGSTAHDYEPYTGGKPSPSPEYPREVKGVSEISGKVVGKNLVSDTENGYVQTDGTVIPYIDVTQNEQVTKNFIKLNPKQKYLTYSYKATVTNNYLWLGIGVYDEKYNFIKRLGGAVSNTSTGSLKSSGTYEIPSNAKYIKVSYRKYNDGILQLEYGQTATNYQPYQSQSFNYTLSNPLYRLSDTVYDYIDLNKGKIVYKTKKVIISIATFNDFEKNNKRCLFYNEIKDRKSYIYDGDPLVLSNIAKSMGNIGKLLQNSNGLWQTTSLVNVYWYPNVYQLGITDEDTLEEANVKLQSFLTNTPLILYYELATPVEEPLPSDLQTLLQSLKTYYPQTNIMFDTEVEPYINFDYKLNLKSWIEDKDNKEIIYDKQNKEKDKYSSTFFENMFALQRTGDIYTVKFPKWGTSHVSTGEKLDANAGLVCEPSTKTIKGQNDYANIPLFKTYDVNAYVDDEGVRHVTAIKGDKDFKDEGKVDVFVLSMSYYEKYWEDEQYWYYSRTDMPKDGYTVARECINRDGTIQPFALYSKYVCGDIDGILYSSKGLMPSRQSSSTAQLGTLNANNSYNGMISAFQKRGKFYSGGMTCDYKYILTTFYLKYATLNSQSIMTGCVNYSFQYVASIQSEDKSTYFPLTKSQANAVEIGSYVSVGYAHINKSTDRYYQNMHMYANDVKVLRKEAIDDNNVAIYLDVKEPFNTMPITVADGVVSDIYISSMHWRSGFSDDVLDRDGCPCDTKTQLINSKFPMVIQGIECMVGGYETYGNAFMDIVDATGKREVYIQNDASLLTTNMTTAKSTYKKSPYSIQPQKLNSWNYITRIDFDLENGAFVQTNVGQDGSSTTTGFADGVYVDNASSGQREFLGFGRLGDGSLAGLSCLAAGDGVGAAYWLILARLSINGVGGELTA